MDANPDDNTIVQYFDITDGVFSKSYDEPTGSFCASCYTISESGDMYGTSFLYFYSPEKRMAADLYIAEGTTVGTQVKIGLYHNEDGEYVLKRESDWIDITAENIGRWNTFEFTNEYFFTFDEDEQYRNVLVMATVSYDNDSDNIYFGTSNLLSTRGHRSMEYFARRDTWHYEAPDIALRFYETGTSSHTITVLPNNYDYGYVSGGGEYQHGSNINISATPYNGYEFVSWNDGNTNNPRTITVTSNTTYIANFQPITHTITVLTSNDEYGYTSGSGEYQPGEVISISATAYSGYVFTSWNDDNTDNPRTITVTGDATYIASFEEAVNMYTINVLPANLNQGTTTGSGTYLEGSQITITAIPNDGFRFVTWNDGNTDNPRIVTVTQDATYIANFEPIPTYTITVYSINDSYGNAVGGGTYQEGSTVTIRAIPANGYVFTSWYDDNMENPRTIIVTGDATYIAYFADITSVTTYTIDVISANEEQGNVTGSGIYAEGTIITIGAIPRNGYRFKQWDDGNTDNPRTITVTEDHRYIASFEEIPTYTITVLSGNEAFGHVTGGGIYPEGSIITITAIPSPRYVFTQWNDGNTDNPRQITVVGDATYIATFNRGNGIEENINPEISIYPNPTSDMLYITSSETISSVEIVNITGQVVSRMELCNDNVACNVEELKAGMYFVKIRCKSLNGDEGLAIIKKFVKE